MAIVTHTIKGHQYDYEHTRHGTQVDCVRIKDGRSDGRRARSSSFQDVTRLSNSPYATSSYSSQTDLDENVRAAYKQGYGTKRIQGMFAELDLHPTRGQIENYLTQDLKIVLRKKTSSVNKPKTSFEKRTAEAKAEFLKAKETAVDKGSQKLRIKEMEKCAVRDAAYIEKLKAKLRYYRDIGRAPTEEEIEYIFDTK